MTTQLQWLAERYGFASWKDASTPKPGQEESFLWQFALFGREIAGWTAHRVQRTALSNTVRANFSIWRPASGDASSLLAVDVFELPSRGEARAHLLEVLGEFQGPLLARREDVGAIAFASGDAALIFTRANLVLVIRSVERVLAPVPAVARALDQYLLTRPTPTPGVGPEIRAFRSATEKASRGSPAPLVVEAIESQERPIWYKVFATGGEVRVEGGQLVYVAAATGLQQLTLFAIGADGSATAQRLTLDVVD